jgi:hypothetical protein
MPVLPSLLSASLAVQRGPKESANDGPCVLSSLAARPCGALPYLLPHEQADFLRRAPNPTDTIGSDSKRSKLFNRLGYQANLRRVRVPGGRADFYLPDSLESSDRLWGSDTEDAVLAVFNVVTHRGGRCSKAARRATVLDIGSNEGFFGLLASSWGCLTYFFEPQLSCQAAIYTALLLNGFGVDVARVVPRPVSSTRMSMVVSASAPCVDQFPRRRGSYDARKRPLLLERRPDQRRVRSVNVSAVLAASPWRPGMDANGGVEQGVQRRAGAKEEEEEVLLAKVDVEGGELGVLESLLPLMRRRRLLNLVVEITPGWWVGGVKKYGCPSEGGCAESAARAIGIAREIDRAGYVVGAIPGLDRGVPAACDAHGKVVPRARFARRGFKPPPGSPCTFGAFLSRTMNETVHEVYQQDVWLTLEAEQLK